MFNNTNTKQSEVLFMVYMDINSDPCPISEALVQRLVKAKRMKPPERYMGPPSLQHSTRHAAYEIKKDGTPPIAVTLLIPSEEIGWTSIPLQRMSLVPRFLTDGTDLLVCTALNGDEFEVQVIWTFDKDMSWEFSVHEEASLKNESSKLAHRMLATTR